MSQDRISNANNPAASCCDGKARFESRDMAAAVGNRKTRRNGNRLHPYHYSYCNGWHLGGGKGAPRAKDKRPPMGRWKTGGFGGHRRG